MSHKNEVVGTTSCFFVLSAHACAPHAGDVAPRCHGRVPERVPGAARFVTYLSETDLPVTMTEAVIGSPNLAEC